MKKLLLIITSIILSLPSWAQLSESDLNKLAAAVKSNYEKSQIEGSSLYKTSSGYQVLVTITSTSSARSVEDQNREAQMKATRLASEYLSGAVNRAETIHSTQSTNNSSKEELSDKIVQSSLAQVKNLQPLFKIQTDEGEAVFAYYLVISQTAAKNGIAGVISIIPGLGQFYKGSKGKGFMFLGLGAASVAGIIVCECTRASYANKAIEQPKYKKEYSTDADNWAIGRNVCIGVGGAIWLWNIIDAFTAKSAKRKVVTTPNSSLSVQPYAAPNFTGQGVDVGVGLTFNF